MCVMQLRTPHVGRLGIGLPVTVHSTDIDGWGDATYDSYGS